MQEELLDLVDETDKIIGTTTKIDAHKNGYAHRVAAIFVFDENKNLLVQLRKTDNLLDHSSAGNIVSGETYNQAATRELKEELGLSCQIKKVGIFYADERVPILKLKIVHWFGLYEARPEKKLLNEMVLLDEEVAKIIPMSIDEIIKSMNEEPMKWTTGFKFTLNFYIRQKGLDFPLVKIK